MAGAEPSSRGPKFLGSYLFQLDEKGRVALPAAFRREAADQRFVLLQAYAPSLALYPEAEWAGVEERLRDLVKHQPEARLYVLSVMSNAVEVVPDSQGRILIPARLKEAAHLDGQALLVGSIDKIEIWNPGRFEAAIQAGAAGFEQFAPQIFR
ncbi:MAG TPA: division/cell wall cluster transcriptional repressor MraZ [Longimicrobiales bacterium]|nr:division/cell wall cluster transcriptional repressor MraZ [Longimicrobiales bacterium]